MSKLRPCPSCARHVRADEATCPFCDAELPAPEPRAFDHARAAGRAAVVFATAAAISVSACGKKDGVGSSGAVVAVYGPPPQVEELKDASPGPESPPANPRDAGTD